MDKFSKVYIETPQETHIEPKNEKLKDSLIQTS